ncbi:dTDP-4-dehydrorhamnose reductase [Candidatus Peregrinibacteria bacterium]|nr:dTDP-4-dehydrorhamnose reductase [Candidatus Peregrinibacteria bacterium]
MLGSAIFNELSRSNHDVVGFVRDELDICDFYNVEKSLSDIKPDIVINCAAYTDVDGCESNNEKAMLVNGEALKNMAIVCNRLGAYLIHFSTDYVFNGENEKGYKENDKPYPINVYGQSKFLGEDMIRKNTDKFAIVRTSWLFGPNGKNFVSTMLDLARRMDSLNIVDDQFGCPTYTIDLAKATVYEFVNSEQKNGVFHLTNTGSTNWYDFARLILKDTGVDINPVASEEFKRPARRPKHSILINTKLNKLRNFDEALHEYLSS